MIDFTMRVDMKDQKIKITFTHLSISFPDGGDGVAVLESRMADVRPALIKLGEKLKASIEKGKSNNNW